MPRPSVRLSPRPAAKECHEGMVQDEPCNLFQCEEACKWDQWTEWSGCRCNVTVEHRNRTLKAYASGGVDMTCNLDDGALRHIGAVSWLCGAALIAALQKSMKRGARDGPQVWSAGRAEVLAETTPRLGITKELAM